MSTVITLEAKTFRKSAQPSMSALDQAWEAELLSLGRQVRRRAAAEGAIRLRALMEIDARLSTDALCELASRLD